MTVETIALTEQDARRLTERIRTALDRVSSAWSDLAERVAEAYERRADLALGYGSWAEYAEAELRPSEGLAADVRRQLVGMLSAQGMSTRAIAPAVGASRMAVHRDLVAGVTERDTSPAAPERIDPATGEVVPAPAKVVGLDGKSYARPEPKTPRRRPLPDAFADILYDLDRRVESLARLVQDDRFPANRETVCLRSFAQAKQTASTLAQVLAALETNSQKV